MIFDASEKLSDAQAVTATAISENVIQWKETGTIYGSSAQIVRDPGRSTHIPLLIQIVEDFAALTSLTITAETSDAAALTSSTVLWSSGAIPVADLVAGYRPAVPPLLPERAIGDYFGLRFTVGGVNATAGKITAGIVGGVHTNPL